MTHLILIGLRGSGKTAAGRRAAALLGYDFVDLDALLEARGRTIPEIFATSGEVGFRKLEREAIQSLEPTTHTVVATGGGAVLDESNRSKLRGLGQMVYLVARPETLAARVAGSDRPRLTGGNPLEETRLLLERRDPLYRELAHHVLDTEPLDIEQVAEALARLVRHASAQDG
ncbi:MAG: shikimate kinase [bacterium]